MSDKLTKPLIRDQPIFVIRRKSTLQFWTKRCGWNDDIRMAMIVSRTKAKGFVRCDTGLDMEEVDILEVVPTLKEGQ